MKQRETLKGQTKSTVVEYESQSNEMKELAGVELLLTLME